MVTVAYTLLHVIHSSPGELVHALLLLATCGTAGLTCHSAMKNDQHAGIARNPDATVQAIRTNLIWYLEMRTKLWRERQGRPLGRRLSNTAPVAQARNLHQISKTPFQPHHRQAYLPKSCHICHSLLFQSNYKTMATYVAVADH